MNTLRQTFDSLVRDYKNLDKLVLQTEFDIGSFLKLIDDSEVFTVASCHEGKFSEVRQEMGSGNDHSRQSTDFTLHIDGAYLEKVPDYVILYCNNGGNEKASTYLADVPLALKDFSQQEISVLEGVNFVYIDKNKNEITHPMIFKNRDTGEYNSNYSGRGYVKPNEYISQEMIEYIPVVNKFINSLSNSVSFRHILKTNDFFLFDNQKYLHGRSSDGIDPNRYLYRVWLYIK